MAQLATSTGPGVTLERRPWSIQGHASRRADTRRSSSGSSGYAPSGDHGHGPMESTPDRLHLRCWGFLCASASSWPYGLLGASPRRPRPRPISVRQTADCRTTGTWDQPVFRCVKEGEAAAQREGKCDAGSAWACCSLDQPRLDALRPAPAPHAAFDWSRLVGMGLGPSCHRWRTASSARPAGRIKRPTLAHAPADAHGRRGLGGQRGRMRMT